MKLALMKKEARDVAKRLKDRLQKAIDENREPSAEEETDNTKDEARLAELKPQIDRAEALQTRLSGVPTFADDVSDVEGNADTETRRGQNDGFGNLAEFAVAVMFANPGAGSAHSVDQRLSAPTNVIMEGGDNTGSYLVPAEFRDQIISLVYEDEDDPIMDLFAPQPTGSNRVQLLGSEVTPWGSNGILAKWRTEAEQMTPSRLSLKPFEVKLNELYAFVLATEEMLQDAPRLNALLTTGAAEAIRWKASDSFIWGDGIEKPQGYMNSGALVTVAKESGQAADSLLPANVAKMYSRMINPGRAVWLANSDIMPQIMSFQSANGQLIWHSNYQAAPGGTLLGRPVYFTEHATTIGDKGDLQFVNPRGYQSFKRQNAVSFAESIHLYFDYNIRAFRWIFRFGGQPLLSAPVTRPNSANTKSHFVALEARG